MFSFLTKSLPFRGSALFRGTWPLRRENFEDLRQRGIELTEAEAQGDAAWALGLKHPRWGEATLLFLREMPMPPPEFIDIDPQLNQDEADELKSCGTSVQLVMQGDKNNLLRDRKGALCFLHAVLGEEGIGAVDHISQKFWHRGALEIETAHSADLDVDGLMSFHSVIDESEQPAWLHSHGLGEMGFCDFDILRPHPDLLDNAYAALRCVAFHILEGSFAVGKEREFASGQPPVRAVAAREFMAKAAASHTALRDDSSGDHAENRIVLCDSGGGLFRSLLGNKPQPCQWLSAPYDERCAIQFSRAATELMSARARATFDFFTAITAELAEFESTPVIKLGYGVDGGSEDDREHLWFEFHGLRDGEADATLLNEPFSIAAMKNGQRALHSLDRLTDWSVFTPLGPVNPNSSRALRFIRANREQVRGQIREAKASP